MSKRGENIYKRKDNRWEGRYIKGRTLQGRIAYGYVYAKTYREAREKLNAAKRNPTPQTVPNDRRFENFCDEWLTLARHRVKESTFAKYHTVIERHIKPRLGHCFPQDLHSTHIESFSDALLCAGLATKTVREDRKSVV